MQDALAHFLWRLMFGIALVLGVMPRQRVALPFFRIVLLVQMGLAVLLTLVDRAGWGLPAVLALIAFTGSACWMLGAARAGTVHLFLLAAGTGAGLLHWRLASAVWSGTSGAMVLASDAVSAAVLGTTFTGMLLGHRYLTAPGMPLHPLQRVNGLLGLAGAARLVLSALALPLFWNELATSNLGIWCGLRWLASVIAPLVVCALVRAILKHRNTQAATGVLFVGVILAFMGEMSAELLQLQLKDRLGRMVPV